MSVSFLTRRAEIMGLKAKLRPVRMYSTTYSFSSFLPAAAISYPSVRILPMYSATDWFPFCVIARVSRVFATLARLCDEYMASIADQTFVVVSWASTSRASEPRVRLMTCWSLTNHSLYARLGTLMSLLLPSLPSISTGRGWRCTGEVPFKT